MKYKNLKHFLRNDINFLYILFLIEIKKNIHINFYNKKTNLYNELNTETLTT